MTLTQFFDRVCVMGLPYKEDRRERLSANLREMRVADPEAVTWYRAISGDWCWAPACFQGGNGRRGHRRSHFKRTRFGRHCEAYARRGSEMADGRAVARRARPAMPRRSRQITQFEDAETGMANYGFRYYAPQLGRWIKRDPIGESGGLNLYLALSNNPVSNNDYLGLIEVLPDLFIEQWACLNFERNAGLANARYTIVDLGDGRSMRKLDESGPLFPYGDQADNTRAAVLSHGCVGVVCLLMGVKRRNNSARNALDYSNCFTAFAQAQFLAVRMNSENKCPGTNCQGEPSKARVFSVHLWAKKGDVNEGGEGGRVDISNWLGRNDDLRKENGAGNFDYAFLLDDDWYFNFGDGAIGSGFLVGANLGVVEGAAGWGGMKFVIHDPKDWNNQWSPETDPAKNKTFYNTQLWCVMCDRNDARDEQLKLQKGDPNVK